MAARRGLRSVGTDPAPARPARPARPRSPKVKSVKEAAAKGTPRDLLVAMRDRIAEDLDSRATMARDLASLSKRLMELQREIAAIDAAAEQEARSATVPDEPFDTSAV